MFDLFRSRAKAMRYVLGALLLMVALSMVVTLIPGFGAGGAQSDLVLAEVGGEQIMVREAVAVIRNQLKSNEIPQEMYQHYVPMVVNQMIADRAVAYQAERMGFRVTDQELAQTIVTVIPGLAPEGKFVGKEAYRQYLSQMGVTIPEFESTLKKQMLVTKLHNMVSDGIVVSPTEIEEQYRLRNEKFKLDYVLFDGQAMRSQVVVTDAEVKDHYEKNKNVFQTPEKRAFDMLIVDEARVAAQTTISDQELRQAYDANRDRFRTPERVKVRHILLKTTEKPKEEAPKLKAKADDLLKQIRGGADFAELAKKNSEDPGSAPMGGDLGWVVRGQMVAKFQDAAFSLKPKEISNVVETEYGYHIVQVMEKESSRMKPFEEVKAELAGERRTQVIGERLGQLADQARAELAKNPQQAQEIATRMGIDYARVDSAGRGDPLPEIGVNDDFTTAVFGTAKGTVTGVVQVAGNKYAVAAVREVIAPGQAALDHVQAQIRSQLQDTASYRLANDRAAEMGNKLKAPGADFKAVAKAMKGEVKTSAEMTREGDLPGIGTVATMSELFKQPVGATGGPYNIGGKIVVARLASKTAPDMSKLDAERPRLLTELRQRSGRERKELFEDGIVTRLIDEGKIKINDAAVKRLISSYRS